MIRYRKMTRIGKALENFPKNKRWVFICISFLVNLTFSQIDIKKLALDHHYFKLGNNLQVIMQPDTEASNVSVEFWIKTGSREEGIGQHGLAHFFEHVTPYGFRQNGDKRKLLNEKYYVDSNAQTKDDYTRYNLTVKPGGIRLALEYTLERLMAKEDDITTAKVEKERERVLAEIERNSKNPFWSAEGKMALRRATFGADHPYGHGAYGTLENNKAFKLIDFQKWFSAHMRPDNIILFVVGNFDFVETKGLVKRLFLINKAVGQPERTNIPAPVGFGRNLAVAVNSSKNYINYLWAVPRWKSPRHGEIRILAHILDERLNGLALGSNIVLGASSTGLLNVFEHAGQFGISASFSSAGDSTMVRNLLDKEIRDLSSNGVTPSEVERAKQKEVETIQEMQGNLGFQYSRTELLGEGTLFAGDPNHFYRRLRRQMRLDASDIDRLVRKWPWKRRSQVVFTGMTD